MNSRGEDKYGLPRPRSTVRSALIRFVAAGLVALFVVSVGGWWAARRAAEREAIEEARLRTVTLAQAVVEPSLTDEMLAGSPRALSRFDAIVRERILGDEVLRVKIWRSDGTIVYADQADLIGTRFPLDEEELGALRSGTTLAETSDLSKPENRLDRGRGPLLEVYLPVRTPGGEDLLFETYQPRSAVASRRGEVLADFMPIMVGGLGVLLAMLATLAGTLAHRLELARTDRERLLRHAIEGSAPERARLADPVPEEV